MGRILRVANPDPIGRRPGFLINESIKLFRLSDHFQIA
jgi:hypothetical protein